MRWRLTLCLMLLLLQAAGFPSFHQGGHVGGVRGSLKPGTYHNLRLTEPIVLSKGVYTFINLEMKGIVPPSTKADMSGARGPGLWIDGLTATSVRFVDCHFTEIENGTVLKLKGKVIMENCKFEGTDWKIETLEKGKPNQNVGKTAIEYHQGFGITITNSTFQNLNYGVVLFGSSSDFTKDNSIRENLFDNNEQNIRFKSNYNANHKLELKCNTFTTPSSPAPFTTRYGMWVEAGAEMPDIGGTGNNGNIPPAANFWPVAGTSNSTLSPWPVTALSGGGGVEHWFSPTGWETVHNLTTEFWNYFSYKNEFLGPFSNPSGGIVYFDQTVVNRMVRSSSNQVIPTGELYDDACSNFGQVLVFPTRPGHSQDSTLTAKTNLSGKTEGCLDQNIPNPATNSTTIGYRLPADAKASKLELFELSTGRIVKLVGIPVSGQGQIEMSLTGLPAGIYGYRLLSGGRAMDWKKMIIIR